MSQETREELREELLNFQECHWKPGDPAPLGGREWGAKPWGTPWWKGGPVHPSQQLPAEVLDRLQQMPQHRPEDLDMEGWIRRGGLVGACRVPPPDKEMKELD